jgi:hypothetical protein
MVSGTSFTVFVKNKRTRILKKISPVKHTYPVDPGSGKNFIPDPDPGSRG